MQKKKECIVLNKPLITDGRDWDKLTVMGKVCNSSLWKRVIAWERRRGASGYGIIWGDADRNKQGGI